MSKTEVVKVNEGGLPAEYLNDMLEDAGMGMEETRVEDITVPFLAILQALNPQLDERDPSFIKGAKKGQIFINASGQIFDKVQVIPCFFQTKWLEWKPRKAGGGLVNIHADETCLANTKKGDKGQDITPDGNEIVKTAHFYVLILQDNGDFTPAVIAMKGTQFKKAKKWNYLTQNNRAKDKNGVPRVLPLFSQVFELTSCGESNADGNWEGWVIHKAADTLAIENGRMFYDAAKAFCQSVKDRKVKTEEPAGTGDFVDAEEVM